MVPPLAGLIVHVTEPGCGLFEVTEAANEIVAPAATLTEAGFIEIFPEKEEVEEDDAGVPLDISRQPPRPMARQRASKIRTKVNR